MQGVGGGPRLERERAREKEKKRRRERKRERERGVREGVMSTGIPLA